MTRVIDVCQDAVRMRNQQASGVGNPITYCDWKAVNGRIVIYPSGTERRVAIQDDESVKILGWPAEESGNSLIEVLNGLTYRSHLIGETKLEATWGNSNGSTTLFWRNEGFKKPGATLATVKQI